MWEHPLTLYIPEAVFVILEENKKIMKKFLITLFVTFSMLLSGCSSSGEEVEDTQDTTETQDDGEENLGVFMVEPKDGVIEAPTFGLKMTLPDDLKEYEDELVFVGEVAPEFSFAKLTLKNAEDVGYSLSDAINIVAYRHEVDPSELITEDNGLTEDMIYYLGTNDTLYYYGIILNELYEKEPEVFTELVLSEVPEENLDLYLNVLANSDGIFDNVEFTDLTLPKIPDATTIDSESLLELTAKDLDGNEVRLGDYIEGNKVTVLNFWGTFCGPCVMEMPFLQEISETYKDQGLGVVGLTDDAVDEDGNIQDDVIEDAHSIIEDNGVEYPILIATPEVLEFCSLSCNPTTFIVDSEGKMLVDPIFGAQGKDQWIKTIETALEKAQ